MKNYVAFESARPTRWRYEFRIYQIKRNNLIYIGDWEISYASTRWDTSEVMNKLIELKYIPKKYKGYYMTNNKFKIKYIVPSNQK